MKQNILIKMQNIINQIDDVKIIKESDYDYIIKELENVARLLKKNSQ